MTMNDHPSEIELLELVEDDLDPPARAAVEAHVASCPQCGATVSQLEQARAALRAAPLPELPPERQAEIFASLGPQERERSGILGFFSSPKRIALVAAPVAAAVVAVVAISLTGGNGSGTSAAKETDNRTPAAPEAQAGAAATTAAAGATQSTPAPAFAETGGAATFSGPAPAAEKTEIRAVGAATDVADELEQSGVHVDRVLDTKVVVTGDPQEVRAALSDRLAKPGEQAVVVEVKPPGGG
jgi:hypothetical protein